MNRKLQRSTLALSATTALLAMLLLAGGPVSPPPPSTAQDVVRLDSTRNLADNGGDVTVDNDASRRNQRRHVRRSRAALALPYFSFAQGLRRVTGS
jgi:hypothetical protein